MIKLATLYARDRGVCWLCGESVRTLDDASRDHVTPVSHGGSNHHTNIKLAHGTCNWIRGNRSLAETAVLFGSEVWRRACVREWTTSDLRRIAAGKKPRKPRPYAVARFPVFSHHEEVFA